MLLNSNRNNEYVKRADGGFARGLHRRALHVRIRAEVRRRALGPQVAHLLHRGHIGAALPAAFATVRSTALSLPNASGWVLGLPQA